MIIMPWASQLTQVQPQPNTVDETLANSELAFGDSPPMTPAQPRCEPSPSPPPRVSHPSVTFSPSPVEDDNIHRHPKDEPGLGDYTLVSLLGNGRNSAVAEAAARRTISSLTQFGGEDGRSDRQLTPDHDRDHPFLDNFTKRGTVFSASAKGRPAIRGHGENSLQSLADRALQAVQVAVGTPPSQHDGTPVIDISDSTRQLTIHDDRSPQERHRTQPSSNHKNGSGGKPDIHGPLLSSVGAGLPPIVSPGSESSGQSLPSILSTLGDIKLPLPDHEVTLRQGPGPTYPHSPPTGTHPLPPFSGSHSSPPISSPDNYPRSLPSPRSLPASSPYNSYANTLPHRPSVDSTSTNHGDGPGVEKGLPPSSIPTSATERMGIDGITHQGIYTCKVTGCKAPPFQTQYLLNSHANVHSSARPHYCPVPGCSRSEGGKGFKRKNEMIRHGLVHDSPGYVCPFCPDRDHKYPRPDNLQRHVRVHHLDKSKDDPLLRQVLAQRADGHNRGRRRRGGV